MSHASMGRTMALLHVGIGRVASLLEFRHRARRQDLWRRARCHVGVTVSGLCQRSRYIGAIAYGAELCYFGVVGFGAEQRVQK
jgi:primosomal replication protein N